MFKASVEADVMMYVLCIRKQNVPSSCCYCVYDRFPRVI